MFQPPSQRHDRPTDEDHSLVVNTGRRLGAAETDRQAGKGRGGGIGRIRSHWLFVDQVFDTQRGDFRAAAATGSESRQKQRPIAQVDRALAGADLQQLGQDIAGHRLFALSLPRPGTGAHGKPQQRVRIYQLVSRRRTVSGACGPSARRRRSERRPASTSAGIPWNGSSARLAVSQRWCATNFKSRLSGAGQGRGCPWRAGTRPQDSRDLTPEP